MIGMCPYVCNNKSQSGYCRTTACVNPLHKGEIDGTNEPERKTGRWIIDGEFIDCSVCRREKWSRVPYEGLVKRFRYCPNCGAKMKVNRNV